MISNHSHSEPDITFLYNVRINSRVRMDRLLSNINQVSLLNAFPISLRVRGDFAGSVAQELASEKVLLFNSQNTSSWKLNLLEQVLQSSSNYFVLMQEDHSLVCDAKFLIDSLADFKRLNLDFMPLSFLPQYNPLVQLMMENGLTLTKSGNVKYLHIDRRVAKLLKKNNNYLINLIGIFSRDLLVRILLSRHPYIKYFAADTPFDVEQRPSQKWFLPINWALPSQEIFACIDDDHGVKGYSLISRELHKNDGERVVDHHKIDEPGKIHSLIGNLNSAKLLKFSRICRYTLMGLFDSFIRGKNQISPSRDGQPLPRSNGPE